MGFLWKGRNMKHKKVTAYTASRKEYDPRQWWASDVESLERIIGLGADKETHVLHKFFRDKLRNMLRRYGETALKSYTIPEDILEKFRNRGDEDE